MALAIPPEQPADDHRKNHRGDPAQDRARKPESQVWGTEMIEDLGSAPFQTTDGDIAIINLDSARQRCWTRFREHPERDKIAEAIIEHEQLKLQFGGDVS